MQSSKLAHGVAAAVRHPDVGAVEGDPGPAAGADKERALRGAVAGTQLRDVEAGGACYPDAGTVEGDPIWRSADRERAQGGAVTGTKLHHCVPRGVAESIIKVANPPNVRAVEADSPRAWIRGWERAQEGAVTGLKLGQRAVAIVRHPDVRAVERDPVRERADRERSLRGAVAGTQSRHGVAVGTRHPDVDAVEGH